LGVCTRSHARENFSAFFADEKIIAEDSRIVKPGKFEDFPDVYACARINARKTETPAMLAQNNQG